MAKTKKILKPVLDKSKSNQITKVNIIDEKPTISISFLDKNNFNLQHLFKCAKGDTKYLKDFESFLDKVRNYKSLKELKMLHCPHCKSADNTDKRSIEKASLLRKEHNVEVDSLIHLHCCRDGKGEFVIHGFEINNHFEIVWLDPKHEIHNKR